MGLKSARWPATKKSIPKSIGKVIVSYQYPQSINNLSNPVVNFDEVISDLSPASSARVSRRFLSRIAKAGNEKAQAMIDKVERFITESRASSSPATTIGMIAGGAGDVYNVVSDGVISAGHPRS